MDSIEVRGMAASAGQVLDESEMGIPSRRHNYCRSQPIIESIDRRSFGNGGFFRMGVT
jgi:hypothetical protein